MACALHPKGNLASFTLAILMLSACSGGGVESSTPPPARVPINTGGGWSDSPFISRDGNRLYFMYSRYDFGPWILSGGATAPVLSGPDRPGLRHSTVNPFDESDIYMATRNADGTWSEPVNLGFNGAWGDASGMEINGGNTFIWLQGDGSTNNIVVAHKNPDGTWTPPEVLGLAINDPSDGDIPDNPHLSPDGQGLWFTSSRAGSVGEKDLWFSLKSGSDWGTPVNMGSSFNSIEDEDQVWISPVGATPEIYWNSPAGIKRCTWSGSGCAATPEVVTIPGCSPPSGFAAEASVTDDGNSLYFACFDQPSAKLRIMYSLKQADGSWGTATPVD